tara:strand:- start:134 stop:907 length:774 start_codon:yes stop_codon:yes gene_type:complete
MATYNLTAAQLRGTNGEGILNSFEIPAVGSFSNLYSVNFDGVDDKANVGNVSELNFNHNDPFTLSIWVKRDVINDSDVIIEKMMTTGNLTGYQLAFLSDNTIRIFVRRQNQTFNRIQRITDTTFTSTTEWYHVVSTYDGSRANTGLKIYVNGSEQASTGYNSMNAGAWNNTADFTIGRSINGNVDEVSVYDSELSVTDITTIYNSGTPGDLASLNPVGWWRMGDNNGGTGITVTDEGSGGNNATLENGPTFETDVPT